MVVSTIYKICHKNPAITNCYVGRTIDVTTRFQQHRTCCNNETSRAHNYKLYKTIRETGGLDNWEFVAIETVEHDPKETALAREREGHWYKQLSATLNQNVPNQDHPTSRKQWRDKNTEYLKEWRKEYVETNKESIKEKHKQYCQINKAKIYAKMKEWVSLNRDKNREYQRERYHKLKQKKAQEEQELKEMVTKDIENIKE
tara:strand:+ start:89 stop:691 length:603 start_codon:yes stop_codon:yes gene_type:complete